MQEVIDIKATFVPLTLCQNLRSREGGFFYCSNLTKVHFAPCHDVELQDSANLNLTDLQTSTEAHNQKGSYVIVRAPAQK